MGREELPILTKDEVALGCWISLWACQRSAAARLHVAGRRAPSVAVPRALPGPGPLPRLVPSPLPGPPRRHFSPRHPRRAQKYLDFVANNHTGIEWIWTDEAGRPSFEQKQYGTNDLSQTLDQMKKSTSEEEPLPSFPHPDAGKTTLTNFCCTAEPINLAGTVKGRKAANARAVSGLDGCEGGEFPMPPPSCSSTTVCINILDAGHQDFSGTHIAPLMAADSAVIVIDSSRAWRPRPSSCLRSASAPHPHFTLHQQV